MKPEETSGLKWGQHPVISAVLWILGADPSTASTTPPTTHFSEKNRSNSGSHNVLWKDEHGGSINEYINLIQTPASSRSSEIPVQLSDSRIAEPGIPLSSSGPQNPLSSIDHPSHDGENGVDTSQSPQWGFYVPITPPQQEVYVKQQKITVQQTIQTDGKNR